MLDVLPHPPLHHVVLVLLVITTVSESLQSRSLFSLVAVNTNSLRPSLISVTVLKLVRSDHPTVLRIVSPVSIAVPFLVIVNDSKFSERNEPLNSYVRTLSATDVVHSRTSISRMSSHSATGG